MTSAGKCIREWKKVFLFGDSITQRSFSPEGCWGSLLTDFLFRRCDVLSRGFSGYNTRACKAILPGLLTPDLAKDVVAVTIFLGANDASSLELNPRQHVPVKEYGAHLKDMVDHCLSVGLRRDQIILITPPAYYREAWDAFCVREGKDGIGSRTNETAQMYANECCQVAKEMGTQVVDLHSEMMKNENFSSYLCDGLHFSESGARLLFELLKPIISKLTSHLPGMLYPEWSDIDNKNYEGAKQSIQVKDWI